MRCVLACAPMLARQFFSGCFGSFVASRGLLEHSSQPRKAPRWRVPFLRCAGLAALLAVTWSATASASPVLLAGTGQEKVHSTHVSVMQKDGMSAVSIMPDYEGSLSPFAVVVPVPKDVEESDVAVIKREFMDRLDKISAPRFAEFWEMDPCKEGEVQQAWERDMTASDDTGFLGVMKTDPSKKVAKEMLMDVEAKEKEGEYTKTFVGTGKEVLSWLSGKDFKLPEGGQASIEKYADQGYNFVAMAVDPNSIELIGADRATLSPIRYFTETKIEKLPIRFGLPSAAKAQELLIFTLVKDQRMQTANYPTKPAPTNLRVKFEVKERMGEFYAALHDKFLEKNPRTFLAEYAYTTADCTKPCPTEPLMPHELLSLGGDAFDETLPEDVRRPEPPEPTEEEQAKFEAQLAGKTPSEKKEFKESWEDDREELAARKALIKRHTYTLSRLHYRYGKDDLPKDPVLEAGAPITGGIDLPKGPEGVASVQVTTADENEFQIRYNHLHPNIKVVECENPKRYRWGKPPRTYRGLNKIWIAEDLSRKNREQIDPAEVVMTSVPQLDLPGRATEEKQEKKSQEPDAEKKEKDDGCGCSTVGTGPRGRLWSLALGLVGLAWLRRRRMAS